MSRLRNYNIYTPSGGRTSIRLEPELCDGVREMAVSYGQTLSRLFTLIQYQTNPKPGERTSAVRVELYRWTRGHRNPAYQAPLHKAVAG